MKTNHAYTAVDGLHFDHICFRILLFFLEFLLGVGDGPNLMSDELEYIYFKYFVAATCVCVVRWQLVRLT